MNTRTRRKKRLELERCECSYDAATGKLHMCDDHAKHADIIEVFMNAFHRAEQRTKEQTP